MTDGNKRELQPNQAHPGKIPGSQVFLTRLTVDSRQVETSKRPQRNLVVHYNTGQSRKWAQRQHPLQQESGEEIREQARAQQGHDRDPKERTHTHECGRMQERRDRNILASGGCTSGDPDVGRAPCVAGIPAPIFGRFDFFASSNAHLAWLSPKEKTTLHWCHVDLWPCTAMVDRNGPTSYRT